MTSPETPAGGVIRLTSPAAAISAQADIPLKAATRLWGEAFLSRN